MNQLSVPYLHIYMKKNVSSCLREDHRVSVTHHLAFKFSKLFAFLFILENSNINHVEYFKVF